MMIEGKMFGIVDFRSFEREIHGDIKKVLRLSYDRLPLAADRNLFLHISCYFIGKDKDYVEKILEPDYFAISGIVTLTNCCLLSVSPNNKLMMHRLLQEMARTIVYDESPSHPGKRSRLWRDKDSHEVLCKRNGSTKVEGLALDMKMLRQERSEQGRKELSDVVISDSFKKMNSLKLLQLNQLEITGSYENILRDLRWLCWREFRLKAIPPELDMENLVAIDMSCSRLEVFQPPDVLPSLQILNLEDSDDLFEISNIYLLPKLETLILSNCRSLVRVCNTLGDLTSLVLLNITGCESLCKRDEIKASLTVGNSREQPSFLLPHSLKRLFLKDCNLEDTDYFPLNFRNQLLLEYLNIVVNPFKYLPSYTHLKNLRVLDLSGCSALKLLLRLPSNLAELYIFYCDSLERVTFESHKYTLQDFGYEGCVNLTEVEDLFKLVPVAKLAETDLGHMKWLKEYQDLEVCLVGNDQLTKGRSLYLQMLYEFNIRSISLPDIEKPNMIPEYDHTSEYPVLSFNVPCPEKRTLRGLNITFKSAMQGDEWVWFAKISTTNGVDLIYNPKVFGKPASDEVGIWLSYWPIGDSLHVGDEVNVSIVVTKGLEITGCGASLVYTEDEEENESFHGCSESFIENNEFSKDVNESFEDNNRHADILGGDNNVSIVVTKGVEIKGCGASLVYAEDEEENEIFYDCSESFVENNEFSKDVNESFKDNNRHADILGGDISGFMLSTGTYYLCRRDYLELMEVGRVTANWFRNLVGNAIDYTEIGGWRTTGRPKQPYRSYTELKTVGCIIYGSEMEDIYKIEKLSKLSLVDKAVEDVNIDYSMESTSSIFSEPISKLTSAVIHVLKTTANFKPQLKKLKTTLDRINPIIEEIHNLNHQLDRSRSESEKFADEIEVAKKLVYKCLKIKWNLFKRFTHSLKLKEVDASLLRFFQLDVKADLIEVNKFEQMHSSGSMSVSTRWGDTGFERERLGWSVPRLPSGIVAFKEPLEKLKAKVLANLDNGDNNDNDDDGFKMEVDDTFDVSKVVVVSAAGGCGKTTLVKMLCHDSDIQEKFGTNVFFVTVSETPNFMVVVDNLFNPHSHSKKVPFQSSEDAQNKLERFFRENVSGPILLVLDDVCSESFIKNFEFDIQSYRVVVTSRMVIPRYNIFQLDPLSDEDAVTLFRNSAKPSHTIDENLVNQMVKCCKKHPLTLSVVGGSLEGEDVSKGHSVLDLNEEVLERLVTSFEALEENLKECYLDFGLFLEDQRIPASALLNMWVHLYDHDDEGIDTLAKIWEFLSEIFFKKELSPIVDFCEQQFVTQHALLRQLAINLNSKLPIAQRPRLLISAQEDLLTTNVPGQDLPVSIESVQEPMQARILSISTGESFSSRWCDMKVPEVEVLVLNLMSKTYTLPHFLKEMQKMNVLNVTNYGLYPTIFENLNVLGCLSNLSRIRLERVTVSSLSRSTLALQNIQKVSFIMCKVGNAFEELGSDNLNVWPKLAEIEMDYCQDLVDFPSILCSSVYLKKVSITNCYEMSEISEEFGKLTSLEILSLRSCTKLEKLPESITNIQNLSILDISDCLSLSELPEYIGNLAGLRAIYMNGCSGIHELPSSVEINVVEEDRLKTFMRII